MKLIQLSDPHLVAPGERLFGIDPAGRLRRAMESIGRFHGDAEFAVITGDLSNDGREGSYRLLREILEEAPLPVELIPGNHDLRAPWRKILGGVQGEYLHFVKRYGGKNFLFLDTLVEGESWGALDGGRLEWLEERLEECEGECYLFLHHHPLPSGLWEMDRLASLRGAEEFWKVMEGSGKVKHLFFGHLHRIFHGSFRGIGFSGGRSTLIQVAYRPDLKEELVTAAEAPAYSVVTIDEWGVRIHRHEFLREEETFAGEWTPERIRRGE